MPFNPPPRRSSVVVGVTAAGLMLILAGCTNHQTPPGSQAAGPAGPRPAQAAAAPGHSAGAAQGGAAAAAQPKYLLPSPLTLAAVRIQPSTSEGGCPTGTVALTGMPRQCDREVGTPLTITAAKVSPVYLHRPPHRPGQQAAPAMYGFVITLPAADHAALTAVATTVINSRGYLRISIAGTTWLLPKLIKPFTAGQLEISFPSKSQTSKLQHLLDPYS